MRTHHTTLRTMLPAALLLAGASARAAAQEKGAARRICLAPPSVEAASGGAAAAANAARETLTSFLAGPSLRAEPLSARLASQVREEARQAGCDFLLLTTVAHEQKRGSGLLGRMAAGAVEQGAWEAAVRSGSTAGRIAGRAAYGAAGQAAYDFATSIHKKDELTLGVRLETRDGAVLVEQRDKRKAKQDGEDLLTPMAQKAAEAIVAAVGRSGR